MGRFRRTLGDPVVAVAYLRVSTEDQNLGPEAQRAAITGWASRAGIRVVSWHEDRVSGGTPADERPGLLAALAAVRQHGAGLLVAAKRDRLARDVVVAATVEKLAEDAGTRIVTADGVSADATPEGALLRGLMDLFAQYERAMIRARTRAALAVKRGRGEHTGGASTRFGFKLAADGRALEPIPAEQEVVRLARALRAEGYTLREVAKILAQRGLRPRNGRAWHAEQVARMTA